MDIKKLILSELKKKNELRVADLIKTTGFSRAYLNRFFKELRGEGKIVLLGKANQAKYILADKEKIFKAKKKINFFRKILINKNLSEDTVLESIKNETGIFFALKKNIIDILDYAFTEMLNNAIEHSRSPKIIVKMWRGLEELHFEVIDRGIGIFNNIMKKKGLKNHLEAIQDLLKGKQTTMPKIHSGEGIFFTSKVSDNLTIISSRKKIIFNNIIDDIFIQDIKDFKGTKVIFLLLKNSDKKLSDIFRRYTEGSYEFSKTKVAVKLYKMGTNYISRSQGRRVLVGLDKFKIVLLDFKKIDTIGQGFADEIFRIWQGKYPQIKIEVKDANENINFMIKRVKK